MVQAYGSPPAVNIAVSQQCNDKVTAMSKDDLSTHIPANNCEALDVDKLKELGIDSCEHWRNTLGRFVLEFHCLETVLEQVAQFCADPTVGKDCAAKVSDGTKHWSPSDTFTPFGEMTPAATEEELALLSACQERTHSQAVPAMTDDGIFETVCKNATGMIKADNLKTLGVSHDRCVKRVSKLIEGQMVFMCVQEPLGMEPADVTAEKLKEHVKEVVDRFRDEASSQFDSLQEEAEQHMKDVVADRLRLYLAVPKRWPGKVHGVSMKSVAVPGVALATMMVAVVFTYGLRRRHLRTVDLGDEMLELADSEESPE